MTFRNRMASRAFTLIELMVVIGILSILVGVLAIAVFDVFGKSKEAETDLTIKTLDSGLKRFNDHMKFFPPGNLYKLTSGYMATGTVIMDPNSTNTGIETLVMALRSQSIEGGRKIDNEFLQTYQSNVDNDAIQENFANVEGALKLFEIRDGWGHPLIYVNLDEARNDPLMLATPMAVTNAEGAIQQIDLNKLLEYIVDPETKISAARSWCIWSLGEDGINQYGRGDDVTSWPKIDADLPEEPAEEE
ncbi:MAG: type II secretion system protein [Planctomycetaceae bacterium]|nr:type II secretion system protein [Planctomycetaceae bacterium]